jgi:hypothetical protein
MTGDSLVVRALRLAAGILGGVALIVLPILSWDNPGFGLGNYFSYFTVLSNVLAVGTLVTCAVASAPESRCFTWIRGLATTCMVITGVVYAALLSGIDVQLNVMWINRVMHLVLPIVLTLDWLLVPGTPGGRSRWAQWLIAPLIYGGYTLVRGPIVDWYPYPFIDPREHGYAAMSAILIGVFAAMALFAFLVDRAGDRIAKRTTALAL